MNENEFQNLVEASWHRPLAAEEEVALRSYLSAHPDARTRWEKEFTLNQSIARLPDVPVSTNFTARVLQAVERDTSQSPRPAGGIFSWLKLKWLPRIAIASLFVSAGFFSIQEYRASKRTEIARDLAAVSSAATFPQEWLQDFDAINRLSQPPVDHELLAALE